ncbi:MAG: hypothetical protein O3A00_24135 [Planctomycetota bacterium]|nr:hypothetical protein [Planctomycetota bacterium]
MKRIFHPLLALIASVTDKELAKYVEYLKHENAILRAGLPKQVHTSWGERQTLLKYGKAVGRAIEELISIVSAATFYRWVREEKHGKPKPKPKNPKGGQRKPAELRELVLKIRSFRICRAGDRLRGAETSAVATRQNRISHDVG